MKKLLLLSLLIVSSLIFSQQAFSQVSNVEYFGGIYEKQIYFNFVMHNLDTCYYVVEMSNDGGREYQEVFCDSVRPMPCPVMHGFQIATNGTEICVKVTIETNGQTIYCQPEDFKSGQYTYVTNVATTKSRVVYGRF